ncbi:hypothetical protein ACS0PU_004772 [Formica fusca]
MELAWRRKIAALSLLLIVDVERRNERLEKRKKRKMWVRNWLQRRNEGRGVLTMLHRELRCEDPQ